MTAVPEPAVKATHAVRIEETGAAFQVMADESVLDAALRTGVALAHECQFGGCGTCRMRVLEGDVRYEEWPMALTPEEGAAGFALACQARPVSDLVLSTAGDPCAAPERLQARVASMQSLHPEVVHLTLQLPDAAPRHRPGQYLRLFTGDGTPRSFSMASAPDGRQVDLHIRRIPGGRFTDTGLAGLRPGDRVEVELPLGSFYYRERDYRPMIFVATGTGMAPIKSILESLLDDDACPPIALYWGGRTAADLYLDESLRGWAGRLCEFRYVPVLSRAGAEWEGRRGYVQDAVLQDCPDLSEHAIYLCGSPVMIAAAREAFLAAGANPAHLYADSFTFQHA